jgi:molecular chaperone DnaK
MPQIEVTFDIDANGIVQVSAKDKGTGKEQQIRIQASGGLSDSEIDKMVKDAELNAEADKKKREAVEVKNQAEALIHSTERTLKEEAAQGVAEADKKAVEEAIAALKTALGSDDVEAIKAKTEALTQASMKIGEAIYKAKAAEGAAPGAEAPHAGPEAGAAGGGEGDARVVDADFEEVDERKKGHQS